MCVYEVLFLAFVWANLLSSSGLEDNVEKITIISENTKQNDLSFFETRLLKDLVEYR